MTVAALLVAAGSGERLGAGMPKALVPCAGRPLLAWPLDVLRAAPEIDEIVVALPAGVDAAGLLPEGVASVAGGAQRSLSVRAALAAVRGDAGLVLVHDAARPLLTAALIADCVRAAAASGTDGAIAAAPVTDTIKQVGPDRAVEGTLDRERLWAVQTPQVFRREALAAALDQDDAILAAATDDAALVEARGGRVVVVSAPAHNLKVTTAEDLTRAAALLAGGGERS